MSVRDMFYEEGKEFSRASEKLFARENLVFNVTEDILVAMEKMQINKKELARKLGKSQSYVTQMLSGARNMTLGTLSDIAFVLGGNVRVKMSVNCRPPVVSDWHELNSAPVRVAHLYRKPRMIMNPSKIHVRRPTNWGYKEVVNG